VSGDDQQGVAGVELPQPVVVRVLDSDGRPVPNAEVAFNVSAGNGSVLPAVVNTDANGAAPTRWTLGKQAGAAQSLTAIVAGTLGHTFHATANAGPLSALAQVTAVPQTIISGAPIPVLEMQLVDAFGNAVRQAGVPVAASIDGRNLVGRSLSGTKTVSTDATGIARFSDLVIRGQPTSWTSGDRALLKFSAAGVQSVTDTLAVEYGAPAILIVNPSSDVTISAGQYLRVDAAIFDAWNNLLPNMHVDYTYPTADGSLTTVEMSDPGVLASIPGVLSLPTAPGTYSVTATSPEVPNQQITFSVTVLPAAPTP